MIHMSQKLTPTQPIEAFQPKEISAATTDLDSLESLQLLADGDLPASLVDEDLAEPDLADIDAVEAEFDPSEAVVNGVMSEADVLSADDEALSADEDVDQIASARPSGYSKTSTDDAVDFF